MRLLIIGAAIVLAALDAVHASQQFREAEQSVVLVTLDGARTEEIFGGLDAGILESTLPRSERLEQQPVYQQFWASTREARRQKLMPFFWGTLMKQYGSIAGDPLLDSDVHVTNGYRVSYPGYSELLVGAPHDDEIKGNEPVRNPHRTVLEAARDELHLSADRVAVFASWNTFHEAASHISAKVLVNAGLDVYESSDPVIRHLSLLQRQTPTPWPLIRHDAYTFRFAMNYLATRQPRLLYIAFDETDDWAHDGKYDHVLEAYARTDAYLAELWSWLQSHDGYRGRTSLLITTDHGRGHTPQDWRTHGRQVVGADRTWMAFVSPGSSRRGEWTAHSALTTGQAAATILSWLGIDSQVLGPEAARPVSTHE
jgi:hypothetical protein